MIVFSTNSIVGQEFLLKSVANIKKMPQSAVKDSLMTAALFQISIAPTTNMEKWRDSLQKFTLSTNYSTAHLVLKIFTTSEFSYGGEKSLEASLKNANELYRQKNFIYATFAFLRIGAIYGFQSIEKENLKNALSFYEQALESAIKSNSDIDIARVYVYFGDYYLKIKEYKKAIGYYEKSFNLVNGKSYEYLFPTIYISLASCYLCINEPFKANQFYNLAIKEVESPKFDYNINYQMYIKQTYFSNVTDFYIENKDYKKAIKSGLEGLKILNQTTSIIGNRVDYDIYRLELLDKLHNSYYNLNQFKNAYFYLKEAQYKKTELDEKNRFKDFNEINLKYQTNRIKFQLSQSQNEKLRSENEKQSQQRWFLVVLCAMSLLSVIYVFITNKSLKSKNEILQKKNKEISEAMLKGQTIERQRVAADLHDNLGSTLSALWLSVDMIDKSKMNTEEQEIHQNLRENLEKAYNDVRLLSHNLLPEEFEKQGLVPALQSFVRKISKNSKIAFDLQIAEDFGRVEHKIEFELYSICLELVNNIVKHSKATEAKIVLARTEKLISLTVSDNGIGTFNNESDGKGMKNVKARVESLNGVWNVKNAENQGTVNLISIPT